MRTNPDIIQSLQSLGLPKGFTFDDLFDTMNVDGEGNISKDDYLTCMHRMLNASDFQKSTLLMCSMGQIKALHIKQIHDVKKDLREGFLSLRAEIHSLRHVRGDHVSEEKKARNDDVRPGCKAVGSSHAVQASSAGPLPPFVARTRLQGHEDRVGSGPLPALELNSLSRAAVATVQPSGGQVPPGSRECSAKRSCAGPVAGLEVAQLAECSSDGTVLADGSAYAGGIMDGGCSNDTLGERDADFAAGMLGAAPGELIRFRTAELDPCSGQALLSPLDATCRDVILASIMDRLCSGGSGEGDVAQETAAGCSDVELLPSPLLSDREVCAVPPVYAGPPVCAAPPASAPTSHVVLERAPFSAQLSAGPSSPVPKGQSRPISPDGGSPRQLEEARGADGGARSCMEPTAACFEEAGAEEAGAEQKPETDSRGRSPRKFKATVHRVTAEALHQLSSSSADAEAPTDGPVATGHLPSGNGSTAIEAPMEDASSAAVSSAPQSPSDGVHSARLPLAPAPASAHYKRRRGRRNQQ